MFKFFKKRNSFATKPEVEKKLNFHRFLAEAEN